jgi:hypothetical protein
MRQRAILAIGIAVLMVLAFAGLGHAFGLFTTQMVATQAAVAYTDSSESGVFALNTLDVNEWEAY